MRRLFIFLAGLVLALTGSASYHVAQAQGFTPTPDQLDVFRNLPADQQMSLVRQFGGGMSSANGLSGSSGNSLRFGQRERDSVNGDMSDNGQQNRNATGEPPEPAIPVLKPEDTVVIEIDFQLKPRPPSSYALPN